jgi:phage tail-like protein
MFHSLGLQSRFLVNVGGLDLGHWATCKGLEVTFVAQEVDAGGFYDAPMLFPEKIKYKDIELTRAMAAASSMALNVWLEASAAEWQLSPEFCIGVPAEIILFDSHYEPIMNWTLPQVIPKEWKGPQFDANGHGVAMETLVLGHTGFLA